MSCPESQPVRVADSSACICVYLWSSAVEILRCVWLRHRWREQNDEGICVHLWFLPPAFIRGSIPIGKYMKMSAIRCLLNPVLRKEGDSYVAQGPDLD
jgi:hypothetical protein